MQPGAPSAAFASLADVLRGAGPHSDLWAAVEWLQQAPAPGVRRIGVELAEALRSGGDVRAALGVKVGRGQSNRLPHAIRQQEQRAAALDQLLPEIEGETFTAKTDRIAELLQADDARVRVLRQHCDDAPAAGSTVRRWYRQR